MSSDEHHAPIDTPGHSPLDHLVDAMSGAPIPAPVRKNFGQALARLCSAAIDIPVAYLEGQSAEQRAHTASRVGLIKSTASEIGEQMRVDPEYARRAGHPIWEQDAS